MSDAVQKVFEVKISYIDTEPDNMYYALIGTIDLMEQLELNQEEKIRIIRTLNEYLKY